MPEWNICSPGIYKEIIDAYYGTILVVDKSGKLIFGKNPDDSKLA